jgi:hypothetical protein
MQIANDQSIFRAESPARQHSEVVATMPQVRFSPSPVNSPPPCTTVEWHAPGHAEMEIMSAFDLCRTLRITPERR